MISVLPDGPSLAIWLMPIAGYLAVIALLGIAYLFAQENEPDDD